MARIPKKKAFILDINLLADWREYASPYDPTNESAPYPPDWHYFGTVTCNGVTGALAWRGGAYGIAVGTAPVHEFGLCERIRLSAILEFESPAVKRPR